MRKIKLKISLDIFDIDELRALRDRNPDNALVQKLVDQIGDGLQSQMDTAGEMHEALIRS